MNIDSKRESATLEFVTVPFLWNITLGNLNKAFVSCLKKIFISLTILIQNLLLAGKCKIKRKPVIHKLFHEVASLVLKKTDNNLILDITVSKQKKE